ncbi:conserved hypothetical protein [Trichinella spiralis]|uniref:hypothetical protein n=1 Tax=Trichinella spiralis TaxID=6334 RepID=UPI0001EFC4E5|nr:conserved hypothetical protein [Trichinella spiralis]
MDQLVEGGPDGVKQQRRVELAHSDRGQQTMAIFVDNPLDSGHAGQADIDVQRFDTPDADSVGQDAGEVGVVDADVAHGTVGTGVDRQHAPGRHVAGHDHEAAGAVDRICGEAVAGQRHRVLAGPSDRGSGPAVAVDGAASVGDRPQKRPQAVEPDQHVRVHVDVEAVGGAVFDNPLQHAQRFVAQIAVRVQVVSLENVAVVVGLLTGVRIDDVQRRPTDDEYNSADQRRRPSASNCLSLVEFRYARLDYHQIITITSRAGSRRTAPRTQHIGGQDAQTAGQWESSVFVVGDHGAGLRLFGAAGGYEVEQSDSTTHHCHHQHSPNYGPAAIGSEPTNHCFLLYVRRKAKFNRLLPNRATRVGSTSRDQKFEYIGSSFIYLTTSPQFTIPPPSNKHTVERI